MKFESTLKAESFDHILVKMLSDEDFSRTFLSNPVEGVRLLDFTLDRAEIEKLEVFAGRLDAALERIDGVSRSFDERLVLCSSAGY